MSSLENIQKLPLEIAVLLSKNEKLQHLLVNSSNNIEDEFTPVSINELLENNYISFTPVVSNNLQDTYRNTFLIINLEEIVFGRNNLIKGVIFIGTDTQHCILTNNKVRTLEMVAEIYDIINNQKVSSAGEIQINYARFVSYSEYLNGYKIVFEVKEQTVRKAEI